MLYSNAQERDLDAGLVLIGRSISQWILKKILSISEVWLILLGTSVV